MSVNLVDGAVDISIDLGKRLGIDDADLSPAALAALRLIFRGLTRALREDLIAAWPVDTGRSLASWTNRWEGLTWVLRNPVEYAEYVHRAGDTEQVWRYLEARSEELLDLQMEAIRSVVDAPGARTAQRALFAAASERLTPRSLSARVFDATRAAFRQVNSRVRTVRQLRRFDEAA